MATSTERPYDNVTIRSPQPIPSPPSRPTPVVERVEERGTVLAPTGPRVRWGGVMSGFVVALGTLMLLTALGLAIGLTALDDLRVVTRQDASFKGRDLRILSQS